MMIWLTAFVSWPDPRGPMCVIFEPMRFEHRSDLLDVVRLHRRT